MMFHHTDNQYEIGFLYFTSKKPATFPYFVSSNEIRRKKTETFWRPRLKSVCLFVDLLKNRRRFVGKQAQIGSKTKRKPLVTPRKLGGTFSCALLIID